MNDLQFFLEVAEAAARQSTCLRRKQGAVIVDQNRHIISTGFNGVPRGMPHCDEIGTCLRNVLEIPRGERYEVCCSIHGEMNALLQAGRNANGCVLYLYCWDVEGAREIIPKPCFLCTKMMINSGIEKVITRQVIYDPIDLYHSYATSLYTKDQHYP